MKNTRPQLHISLSREHKANQPEVADIFGDFDTSFDSGLMRFSSGDLPMQLIVFVGTWAASSAAWDLLKYAVQKLYKRFPKARVTLRDDKAVMYTVRPDLTVGIVVTPDRAPEFKNVKRFGDLAPLFHSRNDRNVPEGWNEVKLSSLGTFLKGSSISKEQLTPTGHNAIRYGELYTKFDFCIKKIYSFIPDDVAKQSTKVQYGDIIFAGSGETIDEIGKSAAYLIKEEAYASGDTIIFRPKEANSLFLAYFLNVGEARKKLRELGQGQSIVHIYKSDLEQLTLHLPPLEEQNEIANILKVWADFIDNLQQKIRYKRIIKKAVIENLLTGRVKLPRFTGEWKEASIGDFAEVANQLNLEDKQYEVMSCTKHRGLVRSLEYFDRKIYGDDLSKYKIVPRGYFAYATNHIEEGSIGYQNILDFGLVSPMYTVFKTKGVNNDFLYGLLKTPRLIFEYQRHMTASVERRGGLRWGSFSKIKVKLPSLEEQNAIAQVIADANKDLSDSMRKLKLLRDQKQYLLNKLVTGEIRVTQRTTKAKTPLTTV